MLERRVARLQRSAERDAIRNGPWRQGRLERALARWRYSWNPETAALRAQRERLPAWSLQEAVVDAVENNQVGSRRSCEVAQEYVDKGCAKPGVKFVCQGATWWCNSWSSATV